MVSVPVGNDVGVPPDGKKANTAAAVVSFSFLVPQPIVKPEGKYDVKLALI